MPRTLILTLLGCLLPTALLAADRSLRRVIDEKIQAAWKQKEIQPAGRAGDAVFLRRVYLDLAGTIPTYEETKRFLDDPASDKRSRLIDQLLDDPRYAIHQADLWDMVLFGRNPPGYYAKDRDGFQNWLREQFARNVPYDQWVRALLKAEGNTVDDGAPMYLIQYDRHPLDATVALTQTFLGVQLQCARCHDHPFELWTQQDFYGMAAFLARLQMVQVGKAGRTSKLMLGEQDTGEILFSGSAKDQTPGKKGEPIKPRFLQGDTLSEPAAPQKGRPARFPSGKAPPPPQFSRKDKLAEWITSPTNPYFARAVANRVWGQFMGRGIVDPVDNLSEINPPSHPELLKALTESLIEHKFDLKGYIRELCNSQTYQRAASGAQTDDAKPRWFERARVRPLSAEELISSWRVATDYEEAETRPKNADRYWPLGSGYMLRFFGKPANGVGNFQGGLHEHLYLNNGPITQLITRKKGGLFDAVLNSKEPADRKVERLYLSILNRKPGPEETKKFSEYLTVQGQEQDRLHEAIWVLLTCSEFRFNH
jgi:hypothetical protein